MVIYDVSEALLKVFRTPKTVFYHIFQIRTDLIKILRGFGSFRLISSFEHLRAISAGSDACMIPFRLIVAFVIIRRP